MRAQAEVWATASGRSCARLGELAHAAAGAGDERFIGMGAWGGGGVL
jgi:hypothetical protein